MHKAIEDNPISKVSESGKFFSPLVRNIATTEGISMEELEAIVGTGKDERVTKNDILAYIESGRSSVEPVKKEVEKPSNKAKPQVQEKIVQKETVKAAIPVSVNGEDEIIEMSRMGKLIAHHMVDSVQTSAHVQSFIEVDVTNIVNWRNKVKEEFNKREGENITYTPIFMQAVANAIKAISND